MGAEHVPCAAEHLTSSQTGVEQSLPDQPDAHEQVSGATHFPLAPQPPVPVPPLPLCGKQMGASQVLPFHPCAQAHVSGAVHFPFTQDSVHTGVSHLPGGPMPLAKYAV